jgi:hypothetical protein
MQGKGNFDQLQECRQIAETYEKKGSVDRRPLTVAVAVDRVEFSPARNSCLAALTRGIRGPRSAVLWYEVVNLLSGEVLFSSSCVQTDPESSNFCGNSQDMAIIEKRDKALQQALGEKRQSSH